MLKTDSKYVYKRQTAEGWTYVVRLSIYGVWEYLGSFDNEAQAAACAKQCMELRRRGHAGETIKQLANRESELTRRDKKVPVRPDPPPAIDAKEVALRRQQMLKQVECWGSVFCYHPDTGTFTRNPYAPRALFITDRAHQRFVNHARRTPEEDQTIEPFPNKRTRYLRMGKGSYMSAAKLAWYLTHNEIHHRFSYVDGDQTNLRIANIKKT